MRTMLDPETRRETIERVRGLTPDSTPSWGSMTAPRMIVHLIDSFRVTFGESHPPHTPGILSTRLARWLVIASPLRWPKGRVAAPPGFLDTEPGDFAADRARLEVYIERFANPESETWGESPLMGRLSAKEWGQLNWRHCDHHLRQFGV